MKETFYFIWGLAIIAALVLIGMTVLWVIAKILKYLSELL